MENLMWTVSSLSKTRHFQLLNLNKYTFFKGVINFKTLFLHFTKILRKEFSTKMMSFILYDIKLYGVIHFTIELTS